MPNPAETDGQNGTRSTARRQVLRATAAGIGVAVAGCASGGSTDDGDDRSDESDNGDGSGNGDGGTDSPGESSALSDTWPMRGRTPGRTYATAAEVPTSLDSLQELSGERTPLVTDAGILTYGGMNPLKLVDPETGEAIYETEYQPSGEVFVHDGTVVFPSDGGVVGVSLESGERAWRKEMGGDPFPAGSGFGYRYGFMADDADSGGMELGVVDYGSRETRWSERVSAGRGSRNFLHPVVDVDSGTLFVADVYVGKGSYPVQDKDHYLRAYDLQSGEQRWQKSGVYYPRAARDRRLLVARLETRHQRRPEFQELVALGAEGGDRQWSRGEAQFSSERFAVDGDGVYVAADSTVHAVGPDGADRWSYRVQGGSKLRALAAAANGVVVGAGSRVLVVEGEGEAAVAGEYDLRDDGGYIVRGIVPTGDRIYALDQKLGVVSLAGG